MSSTSDYLENRNYLEGRTEPELGEIASINGTEIWYHDNGRSGPPLMLVNGFSIGHFGFDFVRPYLGERRLITWEPRGLGRSGRPDPSEHEYSVDVFAEDLRQLLLHLGIERTALWTVGFGDYIGFHFAAKYPEVVSGLITYTDVWSGDQAKDYRRVWPVYKAAVDSYGTKGFGARVLAGLHGIPELPWFFEWDVASITETVHADTVRATVGWGLLDADVRDDLHRIQAPHLVVVGNRPFLAAGTNLDADPSLALIREQIPQTEVEVVEDAHPVLAAVTHPQPCGEAVMRFLGKHGV